MKNIKDWDDKVLYVKKHRSEIENLFNIGKSVKNFNKLDLTSSVLIHSLVVVMNFADMFGLDSDFDAIHEVDRILKHVIAAPEKSKDVPKKPKALGTIGESAVFKRFKK